MGGTDVQSAAPVRVGPRAGVRGQPKSPGKAPPGAETSPGRLARASAKLEWKHARPANASPRHRPAPRKIPPLPEVRLLHSFLVLCRFAAQPLPRLGRRPDRVAQRARPGIPPAGARVRKAARRPASGRPPKGRRLFPDASGSGVGISLSRLPGVNSDRDRCAKGTRNREGLRKLLPGLFPERSFSYWSTTPGSAGLRPHD